MTERQDAVPSRNFCKFSSVIFQWERSLSYNRKWPRIQADLQVLRVHLDTRNWFIKQASNGEGAASAKPESLWLQKYFEEEAEQEGIELFIGHLPDSRLLLLFDLKSVEQFVQRLYNAGLTSKQLPLPDAMTEEEVVTLQSIERHVATSSNKLKSIQKIVSTQNKHVAHEENMSQWGKEYEEVRRIWNGEGNPTFIGFDIETYEFGHKEMLEVGWSIVGPHSDQETFHYIIEEAFSDGLRNGRYVPDHRRNFLFGKVLDKPLVGRLPNWSANGTEIALSTEAGRHFTKTVKQNRRRGPVYIVFHDSQGDMKVMNEFGIDTRDWSYSVFGNSKVPKKRGEEREQSNGDPLLSSIIDKRDASIAGEVLHPVYILDTQLLFAAIRCNGKGEKKSLKNICIALDVNGGDLRCLHNAANDAHYTAAALVKMAQGPHFLAMREVAEKRLAAGEVKNSSNQAQFKSQYKKKTASWD